MKKIYRWLLGMVLAILLIASTGGVVLAVVWEETPGEKTPNAVGLPSSLDNSKTAVGVRVVKTDVSKLSYEIPLYITCAANWSAGTLTFPDNYSIRNNSLNADKTVAPIGVVGGVIKSAPGNTYWVLTRDDPEKLDANYAAYSDTDSRKRRHINVSFDGVLLPSLKIEVGRVNYVTLNAQFYLFGNNDNKDDTYNPIYTELKIPLGGKISSSRLSSKTATPMFQIKYTVSFLDPVTNRMLGTAYEQGTFS